MILGLLTGGILAGQSLIRAAEMRSVSTGFMRYQTAMYSFRDKYFALPGDMNNATAFWGVAAGTGSDATCQNFSSTTAATCNGNGDGNIDAFSESLRSWQHLANAGLVEGSYTGQGYGVNGSVNTTTLGSVPRGRISGTGYSLAYANAGTFGAFSPQQHGNTLFFGGPSDVTRFAALKPEEAWNIDTKMDDGNPTAGKMTVETGGTTCYTGTAPSGSYILTTTTIVCSLRMVVN